MAALITGSDLVAWVMPDGTASEITEARADGVAVVADAQIRSRLSCYFADLGDDEADPAVVQAALLVAASLLKRADTPEGVVSSEFGALRVGRFDPHVEELIAPFQCFTGFA